MKSKTLALAGLLALTPGLLLAQGRGGGGQQAPRQPHGQPPGQHQGQPGSEMGRGATARDRDRDRLRIHATDQQRDVYRTCTQAADRVRANAREMAQSAEGKTFNADETRRQRDQLRDQLRNMEQLHQRLMIGLNHEQRSAMQDRIRNMEQVHERIRASLGKLDEHLAQAAPDGRRVAEEARTVERAIKQWQERHREMGEDLSLVR